MKRIGIDARLIFQTGVGVYLRNLFHYLQATAPSDLQFCIYLRTQDSEKVTFTSQNFITRVVPYQWHSVGEQLGFAREIEKDNVDLMHFTYFSYPVLYKRRFIATVHDLTPLLFKTGKSSTQNPLLYESKHLVFNFILRRQIKNAFHIITPTKTIKKQIGAVYGAQYLEKISALYEGMDYEMQTLLENGSLKDTIKKPFFLYVGNFYPHKNVERLVRAFQHINKDVQLFLVGPNDFFTARITRLIHDLHLDASVKIFTTASREDLVFYYKHALALVHPSLSEGFGLPIIEAAHFNLPIIASNIEVFKELLGENYLSFYPKNEKDISDKIELFLAKKIRFDYSTILSKYSFQEMTKQTLQLYEKYV